MKTILGGSAKYNELCYTAKKEYIAASKAARKYAEDSAHLQQMEDTLWREYMGKLYDALNYYSETNAPCTRTARMHST